MMPDSPETRLGRLERSVAKLEQRVEDVVSGHKDVVAEIKALRTLAVTVAEMRLGLSRVEEMCRETSKREEERERRDDEMREAQLRDSRNWRRALIVGSFAVLGAVITAAATIIATLIS